MTKAKNGTKTPSLTKQDYRSGEVGYKNPPKATQFKPGQSGNPKGRRKGTKNYKTDLREELAQKIRIQEGGETKKVSKQRALIKALVNKGMKGDVRAIEATMRQVHEIELLDSMKVEAQSLSESDQAIIDRFLSSQVERRYPTSDDDSVSSEGESS